MIHQARSVNICQILIGVGALILGGAFYITARAHWQLDFLPDQLYANVNTHDSLSQFGGSLPTLIHVFAFSLITGGIVACSRAACGAVCGAWGFINLAFEFGQLQGIYTTIEPDLLLFSDRIPGFYSLNSFFKNGHFDPADAFSIVVGSILAFWILTITRNRGRFDEKTTDVVAKNH